MSDLGGPVSGPVVTDPGSQQAVEFLGALLTIRAGTGDTAGQFTLIEHQGGRGYGSPLHLHDDAEETFLVLDGELRIEVGGDTHFAGAGAFALLPRRIPHGFVVTSDSARLLTLNQPAGFDRMVREAGIPVGTSARDDGPLDPQQLTEIAARHGVQILGPPLQP
jgi:quercetin dioxygenase-like cupin family protein